MKLEEFIKELEIEDEKKNFRNWINNKFPNGFADYNSYYIITHPWKILDEWMSQLKWAWQRVFRGWDDRAVWSIDYYLSNLIPQLVKKLKEDGVGIPAKMFEGFPHDENGNYGGGVSDMAMQKWHDILDCIIVGFEIYKNTDYMQDGAEESKAFNRSFDLLREYFSNLWD